MLTKTSHRPARLVFALTLVAACSNPQNTDDSVVRVKQAIVNADKVKDSDALSLSTVTFWVDGQGSPYATGVLITPTVVLTAAHVADQVVSGKKPLDKMRAFLGNQAALTGNEAHWAKMPLLHYTYAPSMFARANLDSTDLAIVVLDRPLTGAAPAIVNAVPMSFPTTAQVRSGIRHMLNPGGTTTRYGEKTEATFAVTRYPSLSADFQPSTRCPGKAKANYFYASQPMNGVSPYTTGGDSGAPYFAGDGSNTLVGINSSHCGGSISGVTASYGIVVDVQTQLDWINTAMAIMAPSATIAASIVDLDKDGLVDVIIWLEQDPTQPSTYTVNWIFSNFSAPTDHFTFTTADSNYAAQLAKVTFLTVATRQGVWAPTAINDIILKGKLADGGTIDVPITPESPETLDSSTAALPSSTLDLRDIDRNGIIDVLESPPVDSLASKRDVNVYLGSTSGGILSFARELSAVAVVTNLDNDGFPDFVYSHGTVNALSCASATTPPCGFGIISGMAAAPVQIIPGRFRSENQGFGQSTRGIEDLVLRLTNGSVIQCKASGSGGYTSCSPLITASAADSSKAAAIRKVYANSDPWDDIEVTFGDGHIEYLLGATSTMSRTSTAPAGQFGDFDGDGLMDTAKLVPGAVSWLLSVTFGNGSTFGPLDTLVPISLGTWATGSTTSGFVVGDANEDGLDDVHVDIGDYQQDILGGVTIRPSTGTEPATWYGLPTSIGGDGKFLAIGGRGLATVEDRELDVILVQDAAGPLRVDLFDADYTKYNDEPGAEKTCVQLFPYAEGSDTVAALPLADGSASTWLDVTNATDNDWTTVVNLSTSSAVAAVAGTSTYAYRMRVFLGTDCSSGVSNTISNGMNAFKVRTNATPMIPATQSVPGALGSEFSFIARDAEGKFGRVGSALSPDTTYDGNFAFRFHVGASKNAATLRDADADLIHNPTSPGNAVGMSDDIRYDVFAGGILVGSSFYPRSDGGAIPSGNYSDSNPQFAEQTLTAASTGLEWYWDWSNVAAYNNVHVWFMGSPVHYDVLPGNATWKALSGAMKPGAWASRSDLSTFLPVLLGTPQRWQVVSNVSDALALLTAPAGSANALRGELLAAKLNLRRAESTGEHLAAAWVYGTGLKLMGAVADADKVIASGTIVAAPAFGLLHTANLGEVTYIPPRDWQAPGADSDGDGVANIVDNCPFISNPLQTDADGNGLGDACEVIPAVTCVLARPTGYRAYFGYTNPYIERRIAVGAANHLSGAVTTVVPPSTFPKESRPWAFSVDFSASGSVSWQLGGTSVTATPASAPCSGAALVSWAQAQGAPIVAADSLVLSDRVNVANWATVVNVGTGMTDIGADAVTGTVLAQGNVSLRSRAAVFGSVRTNGTITRQTDVKIYGAQTNLSGTNLPKLEWNATFPAGMTTNVPLEPGQSRNLLPGAYGSVHVSANANLGLSAGTYYVDSLTIESGATLTVDDSAGPIILNIRSQWAFRGKEVIVSTAFPNFFIGYNGAGDASVETALRASVVSPRGKLVLGQTDGLVFEGTFLAKSIEVRPGTIIRFAALPMVPN